MKNAPLMLILLLCAAVIFVGCGKSAEEKKLETDLNAEIMKAHDYSMATVDKIKDLLPAIDQALAKHDELSAKFRKQTAGHSADDLNAVKEQLASAKVAMDKWMKEFKPYDENMNHVEVMAKLAKDKEELAKVNAAAVAAVGKAEEVVDLHKKFAEQLLAKKGKK